MSHELPRLTTGTVLGRYRLERLLGTGGMASVWKSRDERLGRPVAVKILSETLALDADYVKRFRREARIAARLSHPNLVPVFDYGTEGGRPYLVVELVEGGTLAERIEAGRPVDAGLLARQLLSALAYIHTAGVVHRDVKPANVLIDHDGHSRLTDFGVARPEDGAALTEAGKVIGTLGYMAPEVSAGGVATARSDLYSAGVVIGQCLGDDSPAELVSLVHHLTAADSEARPHSAHASLALMEIDPEAPTQAVTAPAPPGGPADRDATSSAGRRRMAIALAASIGALAAGFAFASAVGDDGVGTAQPPPKKAAREPQEVTVTVAEQPPAPTQTARTAETPATDPCTAPQEVIKNLHERRKDVERAFGGDKDAKKGIKEEWKAREDALKQQLESCDEGDYAGPGNGPHGAGPPGQLDYRGGEDD